MTNRYSRHMWALLTLFSRTLRTKSEAIKPSCHFDLNLSPPAACFAIPAQYPAMRSLKRSGCSVHLGVPTLAWSFKRNHWGWPRLIEARNRRVDYEARISRRVCLTLVGLAAGQHGSGTFKKRLSEQRGNWLRACMISGFERLVRPPKTAGANHMPTRFKPEGR